MMNADGGLSPREKRALLLCLAVPILLVGWVRLGPVPGWASVDEAGQVARLQLLREGWPLPWRLGGGSLHLRLQAGWMALWGWRVESLLSFGWMIYLAESALLFKVARAWAGPRAALWAVVVNAFSAVTFTRLGSLLWFQVLPLQWLLLAALLPWAKHPARALVWGLLAGLFLLDYEGWLLALPGLALLMAWTQGRKNFGAAALGFALMAALVAWLNRDWFAATLAVRKIQTWPAGPGVAFSFFIRALRELVLGGGKALPYLGVPYHPQVPVWAWLGFLAAWPLWRARWPWLLAGALPLAALALHAPGVEPNRCLAAWPAFCLFAGAGFARLDEKKWAQPLLALVVLSALIETRAYMFGMRKLAPRFYAGSWNELEAGRLLRANGATLLSDLDLEGGPTLRFAAGPLAPGPVTVLVPWRDQPRLDPALGNWTKIQSAEMEAPLLLLQPVQAGDWAQADQALKKVWPLYHTLPLDQFLAALETATEADLPLRRQRTALWEARFKLSRHLGRPLEGEAARSQQLGFWRADPLIRESRSLALNQPERALGLAEIATHRDPRRLEAWQLRRQLLESLGRPQEAAALQDQLNPAAQKELIRPGWLVE
jgi:hypothetical protein